MSQLFKKAACFTDIHFGMKNNSRQHNIDCENFVIWFIEESKRRGAETCIFLGDWHHHRSTINISTLNYSISNLKRLNDAFETVYFIVGNHDLFYRDKREISSVVFANEIPNIKVVDEWIIQDDVAIIPWLVGDEWKKIKKIKCKYMFGHFELPHFKMNAMIEMPDLGLLRNDHFKNAGHVFTGHFHKRQHSKNISYIGNAFPHNFADVWDDDRGAMFLDWDKEPEYRIWPDAPRYRSINLSKLLEDPETVLEPHSYIRVKVDLDISYEEANFIKENFADNYQIRDIALVPKQKDEHSQEVEGEIIFESVDQIVTNQLAKIESDTFENNILIEIYNNL
tara:strand:- start:107 stop:1120 length:1014 start_codon:yes stop_codon:yes gene_type:complete